MEIRLLDTYGNEQPAAHVNYSIRPGQGLNINLDVFNAELVAANFDAVRADVNAFIEEAMAKGAEEGFPVGNAELQEAENAQG